MPVFLKNASGADIFQCYVCGRISPKIIMHEHHKVKKASGGQDTRDNVVLIDTECHAAIHQIESALKNDKKRLIIPDLLNKLYPNNLKAQKTCFHLATIAALGRDPSEPINNHLEDPDYSAFDTEELVHLTPPKVPPQVKKFASVVAKEVKNPRTGKALGMSGYLRLLVEQDLKKRGFKI